MKTNATTLEYRHQVSPEMRDNRGIVRRMLVSVTSSPIWTFIGHILLDGKKELREAEAFSGVGFYARPKKGNRAEAVLLHPGGAANPIAVATRDEDARKAAVGDLDQDETAMFNTVSVVQCKKTGKIQIRSPGGAATKLPTLDDLQAVVDKLNELIGKYNTHTQAVSGAVAGAPVPPFTVTVNAPSPVGTVVLEAE